MLTLEKLKAMTVNLTLGFRLLRLAGLDLIVPHQFTPPGPQQHFQLIGFGALMPDSGQTDNCPRS